MNVKHRTKQFVAALAVAGAVTAGTAGMAFAADGDGSATQDPSVQAHHHVRRHARAALATVVADTIGISRPELRDALKSGQTIAEVAQAHGVDPQAVIDAALAAINGRVDQAVADGKISAERGEKIKAKAAERASTFVNRQFGQHANA